MKHRTLTPALYCLEERGPANVGYLSSAAPGYLRVPCCCWLPRALSYRVLSLVHRLFSSVSVLYSVSVLLATVPILFSSLSPFLYLSYIVSSLSSLLLFFFISLLCPISSLLCFFSFLFCTSLLRSFSYLLCLVFPFLFSSFCIRLTFNAPSLIYYVLSPLSVLLLSSHVFRTCHILSAPSPVPSLIPSLSPNFCPFSLILSYFCVAFPHLIEILSYHLVLWCSLILCRVLP